MNTVKIISNELSLRKPQYLSLMKLDTILSNIDLKKDGIDEMEAKIMGSFKFDTEFPSFCFALATGVGKTRLMGATVAYLLKKNNYRNFFILAPGETIYTKLKNELNKSHEKYIFKGLSDLPEFNLVTGENYEYSNFSNQLFDTSKFNIYIFNIQKIFNERTDVEFRFHRYQETLGSSFADILKSKGDLVVLMDESHRYRAEKSLKAIHYLNPIIGLEFTATPKSNNVIYSYTLGDAIKDTKKAIEKVRKDEAGTEGYVKVPVVIARKDDDSYKGDMDDIKLKDGISRHRRKKSLLYEYSKNNNKPFVLPLTLITTRNIEHSKEIKKRIESKDFFNGEYKGKTLLVHSQSEEGEIRQLLYLESQLNKNEIVIHVNKLKEGWDVKNIYTIIPLRASVSEILTEQTIGRGLRLPFSEVTGYEEIDTLEIISHDRYQEVLEKAQKFIEGLEVKQIGIVEELEPKQISPKGPSRYLIKVPKVKTIIQSKGAITNFEIKVRIEEFKEIQATLISADLVDRKEKELEKIDSSIKENPASYLVRLILMEMVEADISDKDIIQKLVEKYLKQVHKDKRLLAKVVAQHTQKILDDIIKQMHSQLDSEVKIEHRVENEYVEFRDYSKSVEKGLSVKDKDNISDDEIESNIIGGYKKTVFPENSFDSRQEKWFADILDKDKEVESWLRNPKGQFTIRVKIGDYSPDFIVRTKDCMYLVEIKEKRAVENKDPDVFEKANEAKRWCEITSKATKTKWEYKLIPHDKINKTASLKANLSNAVKID
ncbi:MAG: DEAD/DEAH box helicase family protein [Candidatus Omnitrophica bacterium]|nr:DEAD/DEAH box helicase family protein [Candidatus Omnitrophota bacterium]